MDTNENDENLTEDDDNVKYDKPESHKNFWKSFGLDNKAGKLLYYLYGERTKINPDLINPKSFVKKKKEKEEENEAQKKGSRKVQISYPSFKKKNEKENPIDKIPHKKPLSKILEETKNYESIKEIPIHIGKNRNEEIKKLNELFLEKQCKVVPPSCAPIVLTDEERKEIIQSAQKRLTGFSNAHSKEEKMMDALKNYRSELIIELNEKISQYKSITSKEKTNNYVLTTNPRESNEFEYKKIELKNDIDQCKVNIKKIDDLLDLSK
ncbi:hypothetical protein MKS88_004276 [Plasmodium brasilianum]|uniref:Enkurin domain-containing protein n=2 Tax=Plasmodium (Plasmodium) TaxID=418103 RepID=A0A1C3L0R9_PLAMA|nr:conserved Plasmodium protein, unknown function [Plasmodium malariae]KAI4836479.1 hypothetical protein MKS88_004276 [Plasmodium brasilianum]SBT80121.1 conserved Plasmodium protein, unknown function [Plasmodium malariae]SCO93757.1 conserved Plasmodium protein, unknown function [Plasmodium malariae]